MKEEIQKLVDKYRTELHRFEVQNSSTENPFKGLLSEGAIIVYTHIVHDLESILENHTDGEDDSNIDLDGKDIPKWLRQLIDFYRRDGMSNEEIQKWIKEI